MDATMTSPRTRATEQLLAEIRDTNLSYLMLAQSLIRTDREEAMFRLGLSESTLQILERLSPAQILKMASGSTLLIRGSWPPIASCMLFIIRSSISVPRNSR